MKKLIKGILDFRKNVLPERRELFARLATGQSPDALFITCSDSRVAPNWFASTDPGDLFVIRNVGNLVPPCNQKDNKDASVAAAIEFSLWNLKISDIVLCGHSGCGAIQALTSQTEMPEGNLKQWLKHAKPTLEYMASTLKFDSALSEEDRLSQCNVLQQIKHLKTNPIVQERLRNGSLNLHAWWFEIARGNIYAFEESSRKFVLVDEQSARPL